MIFIDYLITKHLDCIQHSDSQSIVKRLGLFAEGVKTTKLDISGMCVAARVYAQTE